jgi:hypoxanthine phosphoribosyltransferase
MGMENQKTIKVHNKDFRLFITEAQIQKEVARIASEMNRELADRDPIFLGILNGAFMFASDLYKQLKFPCQITFLKLASYSGTYSTGSVKQLIGIGQDLKDRVVVVLEDIVDTGVTLETILRQLSGYQPREIKVATLLYKPDAALTEVKLDYVGMNIPNDFILGYGLDFDGYGRNFKEIYQLVG